MLHLSQIEVNTAFFKWFKTALAICLFPLAHFSQAPIAVDDEVYTWDNVTATGNLSTNDLNPGNQVLTYSLLTNTTFGTLTVQSNGEWTFVPTLGLASVNQVISYQVCNPSGQCSSASIAVYIQFHNDPPQPANDFIYVEMNEPRFGNVKWNDIEPDSISDPVSSIDSYSAMTAPLNGSVIMNLDGTFQYTPNTNFTGSDSFLYIMCDPCGACASATVFITVLANNEEPIANDSPVYQFNEDTSYSGNAATLVTDPENDPLTFSSLTAPMHGTVTMNEFGTFVYAPLPNYFGTDNFMYLACDIVGQCVAAFINLNVIDVNDPPATVNENYTIYEDFPQLSGTAGENDSDDGGIITYSLILQPDHGSASVQSNGSFTYSSDADYNGQDRIYIHVCDPQMLCSIDTVFINITPLNDFPIAADDENFGYEDFTLSGSVALNDLDMDGDVLTYTVTVNPVSGTFVMNSNGSYVHTPFANFSGFEVITYQVCDPFNACSTSSLSIEIIEINDDPIIVSDVFTGNEDQMLSGDIRLNDTEPDNEFIHYYTVSEPQHGVLTFELGGQFTYTPNANWFGTEVISLYGCDPCAVCLPATLTINILSVNDLPVANPLSIAVDEDESMGGNLTAQVTDIDDTTFSFTVTSPASHGTFALQSNGSFTFAPVTNYFGTDQITYTTCDDENDCTISTVTITINSVNDAPVAVNDAATTSEDTVLNATVANDYDVDDNQIFYSLISSPMQGTISMSANGSYTYTPAPNFNGMDMITYSVCDDENACDAGVLTIEVQPVNDEPTAVNDYNVTYVNSALGGNVANNDYDGDGDALTYSIITTALNGTFNMSSSGSYTYTPSLDYVGTDFIVYAGCDPSNLCAQATLQLTIYATNTPPIATNSNLTTQEDIAITGSLAANVVDEEGGDFIYNIALAPTFGVLLLNENGTYTYTPVANYYGSDSFVFQVCDTGPLCTTATVNIIIHSENDAPTVLGETVTINEDSSTDGNLEANASDPEGDAMTFSILNGPSTGNFVLNTNGSYTFTPVANFNGTVSIQFNVCDTYNACATATLTISVVAINDAPIAVNDIFNTNEDTSLSANVDSNVSDVDGGSLTYTISNSVTNGNLTFNANGSFLYLSNSNYFGTDSFQYSVCDDGGLCSTAIVSITIASVNDLPMANDDFFITDEDVNLSGSAALNDTDADGETLSYNYVSGDTYGVFNLSTNGQFTYSSELNFNGFIFITYSVCDVQNACTQTVLQISVNPINDLPIAINNIFTLEEDGNISDDVGINDSDVENSILTFTFIGAPQNGVLNFNSIGEFNYTPNPNFFGNETIVYQVCDTDGGCSTATVTFNVTPINDPPIVLSEFVNMIEDDTRFGDLALNDSDQDDDVLIYSIVGNVLHGEFLLQSNGVFQYTPTPNYSGMDSVQYMVCDPQNECATAQIVIDVHFMNDTPIAVDESVEVIQDQMYNGSVTTNDFEPDGEILVYAIDADNSNGIFTLNEDGTFTYLPNDGVNGTFFVTYFACDPCAVCSMATLTLHVVQQGEENTPPVAINTLITACQGSSTTIELNDMISDVQDTDALLNITYISPIHGSIEYNELTHQLNYTPDTADFSQVPIAYTVCDNSFIPLCASGVITIDVMSVANIVLDSAIVANVDCFYFNTGSIDIVSVSGSENLIYTWQDGADSQDRTNLSAGDYTVTISSNSACTVPATQTFNVTEPEMLISNISSSVNISDIGSGAINIDIQGGTSPYQVVWAGPSNFNSNTEDIADLLSDGSYSATITDAHGCTAEISTMITALTENNFNWSVQVFPNPFTESFLLKLDGFRGEKINCKIYDAEGRLVLDAYSGLIESNNLVIDTSSFPAGLYLLKLVSPHHVKTIGLIKQ